MENDDDDELAPEHPFSRWMGLLERMGPAGREAVLARRQAEQDRREKRARESPASVKRARKLSFAGALKAAAKVGADLTVAADGSMKFSPPAKSNGNDDEVNPWDTVLTHAADEKRPS